MRDCNYTTMKNYCTGDTYMKKSNFGTLMSYEGFERIIVNPAYDKSANNVNSNKRIIVNPAYDKLVNSNKRIIVNPAYDKYVENYQVSNNRNIFNPIGVL